MEVSGVRKLMRNIDHKILLDLFHPLYFGYIMKHDHRLFLLPQRSSTA